MDQGFAMIRYRQAQPDKASWLRPRRVSEARAQYAKMTKLNAPSYANSAEDDGHSLMDDNDQAFGGLAGAALGGCALSMEACWRAAGL